jgi:hypothetical protein
MNSDDLKIHQYRPLHDEFRPMLGYFNRLAKRMN